MDTIKFRNTNGLPDTNIFSLAFRKEMKVTLPLDQKEGEQEFIHVLEQFSILKKKPKFIILSLLWQRKTGCGLSPPPPPHHHTHVHTNTLIQSKQEKWKYVFVMHWREGANPNCSVCKPRVGGLETEAQPGSPCCSHVTKSTKQELFLQKQHKEEMFCVWNVQILTRQSDCWSLQQNESFL